MTLWPVARPGDGENAHRVQCNSLLRHHGRLYLNTNTTAPGLLISGDEGRSWRAQPIVLAGLPAPPPDRTHDVAGLFVTSGGVMLIVHQLGDGLG
jgi:hypothetical protein